MVQRESFSHTHISYVDNVYFHLSQVYRCNWILHQVTTPVVEKKKKVPIWETCGVGVQKVLICDSVECLWSSVHSRVCTHSREMMAFHGTDNHTGLRGRVEYWYSSFSDVMIIEHISWCQNLDMTCDIYPDVTSNAKTQLFGLLVLVNHMYCQE